MRAYQSSSIAEESGLSLKPELTVLYKVNNANSQSFNSTLNERLSLVESLRSAQEILDDVGVIGDSMDSQVIILRHISKNIFYYLLYFSRSFHQL